MPYYFSTIDTSEKIPFVASQFCYVQGKFLLAIELMLVFSEWHRKD